jgi:plasmid stabilization system protein ParE
MSEYRLTQDADDDLLKMFIYGFETFGLTRRHEHAHHVIFYDEQPDGVLITGVIPERSIRRAVSPQG